MAKQYLITIGTHTETLHYKLTLTKKEAQGISKLLEKHNNKVWLHPPTVGLQIKPADSICPVCNQMMGEEE